MSNFFPIGTFLAVLFGAGQIISQAAKTAPNLGRFKRWGVAIGLYVGFLITLAGFWVLLVMIAVPFQGQMESFIPDIRWLQVLLTSLLVIVVAAPVMGLLHFVARKIYGALSDGTPVPEESEDYLATLPPDQRAKESEQILQAAQAEAAQRAAKDRVDRRF